MTTWLIRLELLRLQKAKVVATDNETVHRKTIRISPRTIDEWVLGLSLLRSSAFSVSNLKNMIFCML